MVPAGLARFAISPHRHSKLHIIRYKFFEITKVASEVGNGHGKYRTGQHVLVRPDPLKTMMGKSGGFVYYDPSQNFAMSADFASKARLAQQ